MATTDNPLTAQQARPLHCLPAGPVDPSQEYYHLPESCSDVIPIHTKSYHMYHGIDLIGIFLSWAIQIYKLVTQENKNSILDIITDHNGGKQGSSSVNVMFMCSIV